jgi:hypothetical protein
VRGHRNLGVEFDVKGRITTRCAGGGRRARLNLSGERARRGLPMR